MIENKARSYTGTITCDSAQGLLGSTAVGAKAEVQVVLRGPAPGFTLEGEADLHITGRDFNDLTFPPEPINYDESTGKFAGHIDGGDGDITYEATPSEDFKTVEFKLSGNLRDPKYRILIADIEASGTGTLVDEQENDTTIPDNGGGTNDPDIGQAESRTFQFPAQAAGKVSIDTHGIVHQNGVNSDGAFEYIFLTLRGQGFSRVLLMHAGGGGRAIRYFIEPPGIHRMEVATDHLPNWHTWDVEWGGGHIKFFLDGKQIGQTEPFSGSVDKAVAGGYNDARRNFKGTWRNFQVV